MPSRDAFSAMVGSGSVGVSTFVSWMTANPASVATGTGQALPGYYVQQCTGSTVIPCGIAQMGSRYAPTDENSSNLAAAGSYLGNAGQVGDPIAVYGLGAQGVQLQIGTAVTAGQLLMANASGQGIPATSGGWYGAEAQESGTAGALIRVQVKQGKY